MKRREEMARDLAKSVGLSVSKIKSKGSEFICDCLDELEESDVMDRLGEKIYNQVYDTLERWSEYEWDEEVTRGILDN